MYGEKDIRAERLIQSIFTLIILVPVPLELFSKFFSKLLKPLMALMYPWISYL
jgi:hypothetical protein